MITFPVKRYTYVDNNTQQHLIPVQNPVAQCALSSVPCPPLPAGFLLFSVPTSQPVEVGVWRLEAPCASILVYTAPKSETQALRLNHRRIINTEVRAKVVAAVWGTEFFKFLAAPAILHQDNLKNSKNSSLSSNHPGPIHPIIQIVIVYNSYQRGKELNKFFLLNSSNDLCLFLCINPSSTG